MCYAVVLGKLYQIDVRLWILGGMVTMLLLWLVQVFGEKDLRRYALKEGVLFKQIATLILLLLLTLISTNFRMAQIEQLLGRIQQEEVLMLELIHPMVEKQTSRYGEDATVYQGVFQGKMQKKAYCVMLTTSVPYFIGQSVLIPVDCCFIPRSAGGTGQMDYKNYLLGKNILLQGSIEQATVVPSQERFPGLKVMELDRQGFFEELHYLLQEDASWVEGMVFGQTQNFSDADLQLITRLGLRHLFAVSGYHVGIYYCFLLLVFGLLGCQGWLRSSLMLLGLFFFCWLTGFSASTIRASMVLGIYVLSEMLLLCKDMSLSLSLTGIAMLLWHPYYAFDLGFSLSFAATLGIVHLYPLLSALYQNRLFTLGLSAWLFSLPFQSVFHHISWIGILLTPFFSLFLACILPVTLLMYLSPISLVTQIMGSGLKSILHIQRLILHLFETDSFWGGIPSKSILCFPTLPLSRIFFFYCCLTILIVLGKKMDHQSRVKRHRILVSLLIVCLVVFLSLPIPSKGLEVAFLNVGQGDSILVQYGKFCMLVDAGTPWAGEYVVCPFLRSKNIQKLDVLVVTHLDQDHAGGIEMILQEVEVDYVMLSVGSQSELDSNPPAWWRILQEKRIPYGYHQKEDRFSYRDLCMTVLSPVDAACDSNEGSLVLQLSLDSLCVQLTGDVEGEMLENLVTDFAEVKEFILKAPHHGSVHSLNPEVYDRMPVDVVVFSAGMNNRYGHPHPEVMAYWMDRNAACLRTDHDGELLFRYHKERLTLENDYALW